MFDDRLPQAGRSRIARMRPLSSRTGLALALGAIFGVGACSHDPNPNSSVGTQDVPKNDTISVTETGITGLLANGELHFEIPVTNTKSVPVTGKLQVKVIPVDGTQAVATTEVPYSLAASASDVVKGQVLAPTTSTNQADLVRFSVRVDAAPLRVTRSLMEVVPPYEVRLEGPASIVKSKNVSYRVVAHNMRTEAPVSGVPVSLALVRDNNTVQKIDATTSATGEAVFPVRVDDVGAFAVSAQGAAYGVSPSVQNDVAVQALGSKVLVTTDKPLYKPGQTIHVRTLALSRDGNKPLASTALTLEIEDGKGNKILKKSLTTDAYGIASTDFAIAALVNTGTFKIRGVVGEVTTEKTVTVSQYALPKFEITTKTDKAWYSPGEVVSGTLDARYFFGKVVAGGNVTIEAASLDVGETVFQKFVGKLDEQGHVPFTVQLPSVLAGVPLQQGNALVSLHATVVDTAGQQVDKDLAVTVAASGVQLSVIPEGTALVPGMANELLVFANDPLGNPLANANVELVRIDGTSDEPLRATTDAFGEASLSWAPPSDTTNVNFNATVTPAGGVAVHSSFHFNVQSGERNLLVRTDKAVYDLGETVKVDILASPNTQTVYVDWLNDGQTVDMRTLTVSEGKATFTMPVDGSLSGSNRVEAYLVDKNGNITRCGRTVFARSHGALSVTMSTDKPQYAPGEPAKLTFSVADEQGHPAVAALGVQIVDQAVFALVDAHPGLLRSFFELEDGYAKPTYQLAAPPTTFDNLLFDAPSDATKEGAHQTLAKGAFAALGQGTVTGISKGSWKDVVGKANQILAPAYEEAAKAVSATVHQIASNVMAGLDRNGCNLNAYQCGTTTYQDAFLRGVTERLEVVDFWGNPCKPAGSYWQLTLTSPGPDEVAGTDDDHIFTVDLSDLIPSRQGGTTKFAGEDDRAHDNAAVPMVQGGGVANAGATGSLAPADPAGQSTTPRVRQDFPETLYVNPAVITGPDGVASINLDLADSITEWRVSTLANSADGRLGGSEGGFKVFQDFFVDINFPATLTRGDQVSFPIAVYNYLSEPQTVTLALKLEDWYTALGATTLSVPLQPGQVVGASFPVRVDKVGLRSLMVTATTRR